jgi:hypothetical protein
MGFLGILGRSAAKAATLNKQATVRKELSFMDGGERGGEVIPSIIFQDKEKPAACSVFTL